MPRIEVILNAAGGSFITGETDDLIRSVLAESHIDAEIHLARSGEELESLARSAAKGDAEIIVAGGGDGTISSIAQHVYGSGKVLGVLPLGTLNNFSKDLGIPQELSEAVEVIAEGSVETIDIAEVNGRPFINNSSIGLYPRLVRKREKQQQLGRGKWLAAFWAAVRVFRLSPFLKVRIIVDDREFVRKTPFVFVGNNRYEMDLYNIGRRESLSDAKLSLYFLHRSGRVGVLMLLLHTITGRLRQWEDFEEVLTDSVTIMTRRKRVPIAFDGEVASMASPLNYKIVPAALKVLVPRKESQSS